MSSSWENWSVRLELSYQWMFEVSLSVNSLYGDLTFFDQPKRALRNEQFHQETRDYLKSPKSVKVFLTTMVGDVEVVRGWKSNPIFLIGLTSFLFVAFLFRSIFKVLDLEWTSLFQDLEKTEKILFLALMFSLALAFLLVLFWTMVDEISRRRIQANLKNLPDW